MRDDSNKPKYKDKKPARRPDELIEKLRKNNLSIPEHEELTIKNSIRSIGYYRLSGYFKPFKNGKAFTEGIGFNQIEDLYTFDKELRLLSLRALKTIEINLRACLSDVMSLAYGSDWYIHPHLFHTDRTKNDYVNDPICKDGAIEYVNIKKDINLYNSLISGISKNIERNRGKEYLIHLRTKYDRMETVPSWMMMQCISFGKLSKLYGLLSVSEKREIAKLFGGAIKAETFAGWLESFVLLRNLSAHHERAWNWKFSGGLSFPSRDKNRFVTMMYGMENHPDNDRLRYYYGVSACILRVLNRIAPDEGRKYKENFWNLIDQFSIDIEQMGFPKEFASYDIWKRDV